MGLDIRDVHIVIQYRFSAVLTAADIWQRLGRCARDASIDGLCVVVVDLGDKHVLDNEKPIINGFDYGVALVEETVQLVRTMIATMYADDNKRQGGAWSDPGKTWVCNTKGCRKRIFYALFGEPSAFDFSPTSAFKCGTCDNCLFPARRDYDRLLPPLEFRSYVLAPGGKPPVRMEDKKVAEETHAELWNRRLSAITEQEEIGKRSFHGFTLDKTIRFRDTVAFEERLVQSELQKAREKKDVNNTMLSSSIKKHLQDTWHDIVVREGLEKRFRLIEGLLFKQSDMDKIAAAPEILEFAKDGKREQLAAILRTGGIDLRAQYYDGYVLEIQEAVIEGLNKYQRDLAENQERLQRQAREISLAKKTPTPTPSRRNSRANSLASDVSVVPETPPRSPPPGAPSTTDPNTTGVETPAPNPLPPIRLEAGDIHCPICKQRDGSWGYTPKSGKISAILSHSQTDGHRRAVGANIRGGNQYPHWAGFQAFQAKWCNLIEEWKQRTAAGTTRMGSWIQLEQALARDTFAIHQPLAIYTEGYVAPPQQATTSVTAPQQATTSITAPSQSHNTSSAQPAPRPPNSLQPPNSTPEPLDRRARATTPHPSQLANPPTTFFNLTQDAFSQSQAYSYPNFNQQPTAHPPPPTTPKARGRRSTKSTLPTRGPTNPDTSQPPTPTARGRRSTKSKSTAPIREASPSSSQPANPQDPAPDAPPRRRPTVPITAREKEEFGARETVLRRNLDTQERKQRFQGLLPPKKKKGEDGDKDKGEGPPEKRRKTGHDEPATQSG